MRYHHFELWQPCRRCGTNFKVQASNWREAMAFTDFLCTWCLEEREEPPEAEAQSGSNT